MLNGGQGTLLKIPVTKMLRLGKLKHLGIRVSGATAKYRGNRKDTLQRWSLEIQPITSGDALSIIEP